MKTMLLGGSGMSYEKGLGLGVAYPPNNTLSHLISLILDYEGYNTLNYCRACRSMQYLHP